MKEQTRFEYSIETAYYDYSAWCKPNDMGIFYEGDNNDLLLFIDPDNGDRVVVSSDDCRDDWVS